MAEFNEAVQTMWSWRKLILYLMLLVSIKLLILSELYQVAWIDREIEISSELKFNIAGIDSANFFQLWTR